MAEEIVTRFTADLTDLQAKVKTATAALEGYTETADEAGNAVAAQGKKVGDLEAKTKTLVATEQALTSATKDVTKATVEAGAKGAPAIDKLTKAEKAATVEAKNLAKAQAQVGKTTEGTGAKLSIFGRITQGLSGAFGRIKTSVVEFGRGAKAGFQEAIAGVRNLGGGIGAATSSFGTFGSTALGLLGPIGLGVGALATGLLAVARNTDAGTTAIDGIGRTSGLVFDRITGKVKDLFNVLSGDGVIGQVFSKLAAGAAFFIKTLSPIAPLLAILRVTGISDAFSEDIEEGQRLAQAYDDLEDKQNALNEKTAANEIIIRKNLAALRDVTKPVAERLKLADQITASEKENLALKKVQLYAELAILNARAKGQLERKGKVDDALKAEISALRAGLSTLEADSISLTERVSARRNAILDGEQATNEARLAKEKAARDKAFNEEKQRIEKLSALREQAAQTREELERDALRRQTLGEDGAPTLSTQILDVDFRVEDQIDAAKENAKRQEELAKGNAAELERIAQDLADTIALIRQRGNEEVDAITSKFYKSEEAAAEAAKDRVTDALLSDTDRQVNAISKKYDELIALTDKLTVNEAEKGRIRAQLLLARERELTEIIDEEGRKRLEIQVKLIEELGEGVGEALALLATSFSIGENDINAQFDQQLADLQEANQRELDEIARRNGSQAELEEARNRATASYMDERNRIEQERGQELQENRERQEKEFLKLLLDTLEKVVQIYVAEVIVKQIADGAAQGGVPGALAGAAIGAAIAAIISGIFSALKSSIGGAYRGEEMIGGPAFFSGSRDTHLRRVHPKERIISADKNVKHYDVLHAIHTDKFDQWKRANLMLEMPAMDHLVMPEINRYLDGDTGQRMAASVMLMKYHDKNIVESTNRTTKAQQKTNVLLEQLVEAVTNKPGRGAHYW